MSLLFWIQGEDGEEYGPVDEGELREWMIENRVGLDTLVRREGVDEGWKPCEEIPECTALFSQVSTLEREIKPYSFVLASLSKRILAFAFDLCLILVLLSVLFSLFMPLLPLSYQISEQEVDEMMKEGLMLTRKMVFFYLIQMGFVVAYFTWFHARNGQTPGKRFFRIRVVDEKGLTLSFVHSFLRALAMLLSWPYFLGFLLAFFLPNRRALHDWIARTYVVAVVESGAKNLSSSKEEEEGVNF